jgi:excisionase family DNA binding protein
MLKDGDLMTTGDTAKVLGLSAAMVAKLDSQGHLRALRTVGGFRLFWKRDVDALAVKRAKAKKAKAAR